MTHETRLKISKLSTRINLMNKSVELARAKSFLTNTDYIVIKIYEAVIKGQDTSELLSKYADQLAKRETYRNSIDALEAEVKILEQEWREERARIIAEETSEEAQNDESIENVIEQPVEETPIEQPVEETPIDTGEVVEEMPSEEVTEVTEEPVTEVDTADQTSDNITDITNTTNTSESVEEIPSEQPIKETPTEVVENLE